MTLGVEVRTRTAAVARGVPTATDTLFVPTILPTLGPTDKAVEVRSISDYQVNFGTRTGAHIPVYDGVDTFFKEGGKRAFVARGTTTIDNALALFTKNHGPGQVVNWDEAPVAGVYTKFYSWAHTNDRFFLADVPMGSDRTEMLAASALVPAGADGEYGLMVGPWCNIPAPAGVTGGAERTVPGSAVAAGLIARADGLGNPNRAAAGRDFPLQFVTSFESELSDFDQEALLDGGVNPFANIYGVLELYGFQTVIDQSDANPFWQANCGRARMWLVAQAKAVGENYVFKTIDGKGQLQQKLKSDLEAVCLQLYGVDGLFGETPQEAFAVEVGAAINTTDTIAQGELHAVMEARLGLHAKAVLIDLVSIPVTGNVSTPA
jgi:hypothetical protein